MNIHSTVLEPVKVGDPFLVIAAALPLPHMRVEFYGPHFRDMASTVGEAQEKCCELARAVKKALESVGHPVIGIHCSHCPTPETPACGQLRVV